MFIKPQSDYDISINTANGIGGYGMNDIPKGKKQSILVEGIEPFICSILNSQYIPFQCNCWCCAEENCIKSVFNYLG